MTQQYIIGQFSALLGELQPPPGDWLATAVHDLRRDVESSPLPMLPRLAAEALSLTDMVCWTRLRGWFSVDAAGRGDPWQRCPVTDAITSKSAS